MAAIRLLDFAQPCSRNDGHLAAGAADCAGQQDNTGDTALIG